MKSEHLDHLHHAVAQMRAAASVFEDALPELLKTAAYNLDRFGGVAKLTTDPETQERALYEQEVASWDRNAVEAAWHEWNNFSFSFASFLLRMTDELNTAAEEPLAFEDHKANLAKQAEAIARIEREREQAKAAEERIMWALRLVEAEHEERRVRDEDGGEVVPFKATEMGPIRAVTTQPGGLGRIGRRAEA